ncbi:hypothetical protein BX600DRAFT_458023, partial [Xylariales sp. PMI_506]
FFFFFCVLFRAPGIWILQFVWPAAENFRSQPLSVKYLANSSLTNSVLINRPLRSGTTQIFPLIPNPQRAQSGHPTSTPTTVLVQVGEAHTLHC